MSHHNDIYAMALRREEALMGRYRRMEAARKELRCDAWWGKTFHANVCTVLKDEEAMYDRVAWLLRRSGGRMYPLVEKEYGTFVDSLEEYIKKKESFFSRPNP